MVMISFFKKWLFGRGRRKNIDLLSESSVVVSFDDEKIICKKPKAEDESITWNKLDAVLIETTDEGPLYTDVFWLLLSKDMSSGCLIPQGADGERELLGEMQRRLADFDNAMLIEAMGSSENRRFLIWERKSP
jgi:hypothetical protein